MDQPDVGDRAVVLLTPRRGADTLESLDLVGRTPRSAADALVGLRDRREKPAGGPAADQGVRPTNPL